MIPIKHLATGALALTIPLAAPMAVPAQSTQTPLTPRTFIDVARQVLPGVVSIRTTVPPGENVQRELGVESPEDLREWFRNNDDFFFQFGNPNRQSPFELFEEFSPEDFGSTGSGSGVIIRQEDGQAYVLTNRHVVDENPRARFTITPDVTYDEDFNIEAIEEVELVGADELTDIAVLKFEVPGGIEFPTIEFADSSEVEVGEWVLALGNPLELNNSVSQGIISARNRSLGSYNRIENLLQTTAVINPGNSGGPLVNLDGKIVGINNAIKTSTGNWSGIGFAIPSNEARRVAETLIEEGRVSRGYLGIVMTDVDSPESSVYDLGLGEGVSINEVQPGTPAEEAGLKRGDVVIRVENVEIEDSKELLETIANKRAGDTVSLRVTRYIDGQKEIEDIEVTLMERPSGEELRMAMRDERVFQNDRMRRLGLSVRPARQGDVRGMIVENVRAGSAADRAGLRPGDLLVQINGIELERTADFQSALENAHQGEDHIVVFERDGARQTTTIDPGM